MGEGRDETPRTLRAVVMKAHRRNDPPPGLTSSPLYLLAVLFSARHSKDRALERVTRRHLSKLGFRIAFANELPASAEKAKGDGRG